MPRAPSLSEVACLLVCTSKELRKLLASALRQIGIGTVHEADNLDHAVLLLRYSVLDLVVWAGSDNGHLTLLNVIRREFETDRKKIPFLCVVEKWDGVRLRMARDAGANGFLSLPLTLNETLKRVSTVLCDTREFIDTDAYAGVDRRKTTPPDYRGPRRRAADSQPPVVGPTAKPKSGDSPHQSRQTAPDAADALGISGPAAEQDDPAFDVAQETAVRRSAGQAKSSPMFRRRAQVAYEALRLVDELNTVFGDGKTAQADGEKIKFGELFNRLMNLMVLIHGYSKLDSEEALFFKNKHDEIMSSISRFSRAVLAGGLDRIWKQSNMMIEGTAPTSLGSAFKIGDRMSQFDTLITMLGGYPRIPLDMLDQVSQIWENILKLAEMDKGLKDLDGRNSALYRQAASEKLLVARKILNERLAADSQEAALERMKKQ